MSVEMFKLQQQQQVCCILVQPPCSSSTLQQQNKIKCCPMNVDQLTTLESKLHIKIKKTLLMERHEWNMNGFKDGSYLSSNKRTQVENRK